MPQTVHAVHMIAVFSHYSNLACVGGDPARVCLLIKHMFMLCVPVCMCANGGQKAMSGIIFNHSPC